MFFFSSDFCCPSIVYLALNNSTPSWPQAACENAAFFWLSTRLLERGKGFSEESRKIRISEKPKRWSSCLLKYKKKLKAAEKGIRDDGMTWRVYMERKSDVLVTFILPSSTSCCVLHQAAAMHGKLLLELWGSADTNQVAAADLDAQCCTNMAPKLVPKCGPDSRPQLLIFFKSIHMF